MKRKTATVLTSFALSLLACDAAAQLNERTDDDLGFAIRLPRVRVVHSENSEIPGTSMHLQQTDPWLAYALGHSYFQREWKKNEGLFSDFDPQQPFMRAAANSCAMCHNLPHRSAGSGGNVSHPGGFGRNVPHLFGIGLLETLGFQVRQEILLKYDANRNGFLDVPGEVEGKTAIVEAAPGVQVDFGFLEDRNGDGWPGLNDVVQVTPVDPDGRPIFKADGRPADLRDPGVAGYDLALAHFLSAREIEMASLRLFTVGVLRIIFGMRPHDGTTSNDRGLGRDLRAGDAWAETSNAGAPQRYLPGAGDRADSCESIGEGELDLLEWFLLNHPRPGQTRQNAVTAHGKRLLRELGCTSCHVADWVIRPADENTGMPGDRRFFDFEVGDADGDGRLEGRLRSLTEKSRSPSGEEIETPARGEFVVRGIYTDLLHHDLGERFYEYRRIDGQLYVTRRFRTTPLWGVGSTAPYGHDGRSLALDDVIRRHEGEAARSSEAYSRASPEDRDAVVSFLKSLVLYPPDEIPADINGDGAIDSELLVRGLPVGRERLRPEFIFRTPPRYKGWVVDQTGRRYFSYRMLNSRQAYGRRLTALVDSDSDGIPDLAQCARKADRRGSKPEPIPGGPPPGQE